MQARKPYNEPALADLGDLVAATLGVFEPGEHDPITTYKDEADT